MQVEAYATDMSDPSVPTVWHRGPIFGVCLSSWNSKRDDMSHMPLRWRNGGFLTLGLILKPALNLNSFSATLAEPFELQR